MFASFYRRFSGKRRKYPIKRDSYGRSARQQAFDAFDQGKTLAEVTTIVPISKRTADRYFAYWKKLPKNLDIKYQVSKAVLKTDSEFSPQTVELLAAALGMSEDEVVYRLQKPWGLKQLIMGKWPNYARKERQSINELRLRAALILVLFFEHSELPPERIAIKLIELREKAQKNKEHI